METVKLRLPGNSDFFTQEAYKVLRTNIQFCGQEVKTTADLSLICGICEVAMERAD